MPDISMCGNRKCKLKDRCYRYMAKPNKYRQSYASFKPNLNGMCDAFVDVKYASTECRMGEEINE